MKKIAQMIVIGLFFISPLTFANMNVNTHLATGSVNAHVDSVTKGKSVTTVNSVNKHGLNKVPYGWSKGKKVGWEGQSVPPGHYKKQ
jgi:hypothetical protein